MGDSKAGNFNRLAFKSGSSYMLSNILISATSILTAPIFTRLLSTADYGIASNFAAWLNIGFVIVGLGLPYSIGNAKIDFPYEIDRYITSIQTLGSVMAVSVLLLLIPFREKVAAFMEIDSILVLSIFIYMLVYPSVIYAQERYKFSLEYKRNIFISILNTFGAIAFCLILIIYLFNENRYYGRIIGLILPMFLMGIYFYWKILKDGWSYDIKKYWKYAIKIGLPMIPHSLAMVVLTQIDRIMIVKMCGNADAGLYSFGFSYAVLLLLLSNAILQAYQPWLYIKYKENDLLPIKDSSNLIATALCIVTFGIVAVAPEAITILGAPSFWEAKWVVMPLAIGSLFQYMYNTYTGLELYHKKTIIIAIGTVLVAILNYSLNLFLIPALGYTGAAYATGISYFLLAFFHLFACRMITKKRIYDDNFIWSIAIITSVISFLFTYLYDFILIRYSLLIFILVIIYLMQRRKIRSVINQIFPDKTSTRFE